MSVKVVQMLAVFLLQFMTIMGSRCRIHAYAASDGKRSAAQLEMEILHGSYLHELDKSKNIVEGEHASHAVSNQGLDGKRLERDAARVRSLTSCINPGRPIMSRAEAGGGAGKGAEVIPALRLAGSGDYFIRIGLGGGYHNYMALDTGSELSWIQCKPCGESSCVPQVDRSLFDPSASATLRNVSCKSAVCYRRATTGLIGSCYAGTFNCAYKLDYASGSSTAGSLVTEAITGLTNYNNKHQHHNNMAAVEVILGCGHNNTGSFEGAAGIVGLARGPLSLAGQLSADRHHRPTFSYCLPPRELPSSLNTGPRPAHNITSTGKGSLLLGSSATTAAAQLTDLRYTPLLLHPNPALRTFYYVSLTGITVGASPLPIPPSTFQIDSRTGGGGVVLDSEVAVSRLPPPAYAALRAAFVREALPHLGHPSPIGNGTSFLDTCFDTTSLHHVLRAHDQPPTPIPRVVLHFAGDLDLELPPSNILVWLDDWATASDGSKPPSTQKLCLAFAPAPDSTSFSIIGNVQQQGFHILYDVPRARLGIAPHQC